MRALLLSTLLLTACAGSASDDAATDEAATTRPDTIDAPTDTHVTLAPGLWHDDHLTVLAGWHMYHYTATADGVVAFQMRADPSLAHGNFWTYLRIVDAGQHNEVWAAVANRETNLTDVLVPVEAGHSYQVIATSQNDSDANDANKPNVSVGDYTIAAIPVTASF